MKVLLCSDSFKHSMSALEVCKSLAAGLRAEREDLELTLLPLADGGEGTVQALVDATGGKMVETQVHDPLMRTIPAVFGLLGSGQTAVMEMAAASGIEKLAEHERNPFFATSYGTGELIRSALDQGCQRIILGIGGSATIDGGAGLLHALGARFYDHKKEQIRPTGEKLNDIHHIDISQLDERLKDTAISIAGDVENPLTGPNGAAYVYGPQKGARPDDLEILDRNLESYARLLQHHTSQNLLAMPGLGAAGGLALSLLAFSRATLESGFSLVARELNLEKEIRENDLIITGEGKIDAQTPYGKTPFGVARLANQHNKPVIAVAGSLEADHPEVFDLLLPVMEKPMELQSALEKGRELIYNAGRRIGQIIRLTDRLPRKD